jgi:hypothetical protein
MGGVGLATSAHELHVASDYRISEDSWRHGPRPLDQGLVANQPLSDSRAFDLTAVKQTCTGARHGDFTDTTLFLVRLLNRTDYRPDHPKCTFRVTFEFGYKVHPVCHRYAILHTLLIVS